ncbi:MAG TPA: ribose 5-phosphate isomerase B [Chitinispirillaceae bacterium]|jgi:RpiB/LacA/LacB family sugar-phosphate isomerase|nr:ribose 5-phosphate isomerase B [Chitinispirillaceae bacterium]
MSDKIVIGSDHAGFEMKEYIKEVLTQKGVLFEDAGAVSLDPSDDYPEFAFRVAKAVSEKRYNKGILLCGTGIGASIAANRVKGVRAALCTSPDMARMSRAHNDSNVLVLGGRTTSRETVSEIIDAWLGGSFEGGRHQKRIDQIDK